VPALASRLAKTPANSSSVNNGLLHEPLFEQVARFTPLFEMSASAWFKLNAARTQITEECSCVFYFPLKQGNPLPHRQGADFLAKTLEHSPVMQAGIFRTPSRRRTRRPAPNRRIV
jgi:hypothetical protein